MVNNTCDEIDALLSTVLQRRSGGGESREVDGFTDSEEEMHLHQKVDFLSPSEMISVLKPAVASELVLNVDNDKTSVTMEMPFGTFKVQSSDLGWSESYPSDSMVVEVHFTSIQFNDTKAINRLNIKYPGIGLSQSEGNLVCRRDVILKGGRSVENLLWEILAFTQASERVFKDITVFN